MRKKLRFKTELENLTHYIKTSDTIEVVNSTKSEPENGTNYHWKLDVYNRYLTIRKRNSRRNEKSKIQHKTAFFTFF